MENPLCPTDSYLPNKPYMFNAKRTWEPHVQTVKSYECVCGGSGAAQTSCENTPLVNVIGYATLLCKCDLISSMTYNVSCPQHP